MEHRILQMMKDMIPKTLPTKELSSFEYGVLAGQQLMYNTITELLRVEDTDKHVKDK